MEKRFEKFKEHVKENAFVYIAATGAAVAGITYLIMRERCATAQRGVDGPIVTARSLNLFSKQIINVVNVIEREGRGHPGYIVRCLETGRIFLSQKEVAKTMKVWPSLICDHLKGKIENIHGLHFERVSL